MIEQKFPVERIHRHSFTGNIVKKGVDLAKIQRLMGHENFATAAKHIYELMRV